MQRERTKITLRSDYPTSMSSTKFGANLDGVAFNLTYLKKFPDLYKRVIDLYKDCAKGVQVC